MNDKRKSDEDSPSPSPSKKQKMEVFYDIELGLSGKIGSGKTTLSSGLHEAVHNIVNGDGDGDVGTAFFKDMKFEVLEIPYAKELKRFVYQQCQFLDPSHPTDYLGNDIKSSLISTRLTCSGICLANNL